MNIIIKSFRVEHKIKPYQVRVDRASVLGNPYYLKDESMRDDVCNKYEKYFYEQVEINQEFKDELKRIVQIGRTFGKLELFCWCAPHRCHAETIKNYLNEVFEEYDKRSKKESAS